MLNFTIYMSENRCVHPGIKGKVRILYIVILTHFFSEVRATASVAVHFSIDIDSFVLGIEVVLMSVSTNIMCFILNYVLCLPNKAPLI